MYAGGSTRSTRRGSRPGSRPPARVTRPGRAARRGCARRGCAAPPRRPRAPGCGASWPRERVVLALALEAHERHAVAARVADARRRRRRPTERRASGIDGVVEAPAPSSSAKRGSSWQDDLAAAVQAHDPRRPLEGAEHDADAAVLAQVRDRLGAAAVDVEVGDRVLVEDREGPDRPLGRDVDVALAVERRRGHEEQRLARDPVALVVGELVVDLRHGPAQPTRRTARGTLRADAPPPRGPRRPRRPGRRRRGPRRPPARCRRGRAVALDAPRPRNTGAGESVRGADRRRPARGRSPPAGDLLDAGASAPTGPSTSARPTALLRARRPAGACAGASAPAGSSTRRRRSAPERPVPVTFGSGDEASTGCADGPRRATRASWRAAPTLAPATGQLVNWWEGNAASGPDGTLFVGNTGGGAYALTPTGTLRWAHQRGQLGLDDARRSPATGRRYWGSVDLASFALDRDGHERWSAAALGYVTSSPALGARRRRSTSAPSTAGCTRSTPRTGAERWTLPDRRPRLQLAGAREDAAGSTTAIYIASTDGSVYALAPDGSQRWRYDTGDAVRSSPVLGRAPAAAARIVYVGSATGASTRSTPRTGRRRWSFDTTPRDPALRDRNDLNGSPGARPARASYIGGEHGASGRPLRLLPAPPRPRAATRGPASRSPRDARRLVGVTPGGQLEAARLRPPARCRRPRRCPCTCSSAAGAARSPRAWTRRRRRCGCCRSPRRRRRGRRRPRSTRPSRSGCSRRPTGATSSSSPGAPCGRARRYALRVTGDASAARAFAQTLRLRTAPARRGPRAARRPSSSPAWPCPSRPSWPASTRSASTRPSCSSGPSRATPAHPGEVTLWAIGATRGADGVLRPDPAAATAFALRATWRGDRLWPPPAGPGCASPSATSRRGAWSSGPCWGPHLRPRGAPSLVTETACGGVPGLRAAPARDPALQRRRRPRHLGHGDHAPLPRPGHARAGGRPGRRPRAAPPDGRGAGGGHGAPGGDAAARRPATSSRSCSPTPTPAPPSTSTSRR